MRSKDFSGEDSWQGRRRPLHFPQVNGAGQSGGVQLSPLHGSRKLKCAKKQDKDHLICTVKSQSYRVASAVLDKKGPTHGKM